MAKAKTKTRRKETKEKGVRLISIVFTTYSMNKTLLVLLLLLPSVSAQAIQGHVNDYANVIGPAQEQQIEQVGKQLKDAGLAEYAVVTINSLEGQDIVSYAIELAEGNLGDTEKDNGLLLLVAIEDRKYRFEVGRGLEEDIPDSLAGRIGRDELVPNFRNQDYGLGILEASKAIQARLTNQTESEYYPQATQRAIPPQTAAGMLFFGLLILIAIISIYGFSKKRRGASNNDSDYFVAAWALGHMMGRGRGPGGFGGGSFGGGFGGGSFGGGGAGGGW